MKKIFTKYISVWLLFLFFSALFTYPAILHFSTKFIGDGWDNYQYVSFQYIAHQNIIHFGYPFMDSDIFRYPAGFPFGARFDSIFGTLTGAILSFFLSPVISYNLTVIVIFSLNGFLSFLLFRHISKSTMIGILGGIIYGFSSYALARSVSHLNLLSIGGFPLFVFAVLKLFEKVTVKNIIIFFLSILFIFISSFQYVFLLLLFGLITSPILLVFYKHQSIEFIKKMYPHLVKFLFIGIFFLLLVVPLAFPFLVSMVNGELGKDALLEYNPHLLDFFLPNSVLHLWIVDIVGKWNQSAPSLEKVVFIGWAELLLFLLFFLSKVRGRIKLFIALTTLTFFILATGIKYDLLINLFLFSPIAEPGRFFLIFYLFMVIGITLFLKHVYLFNKKIGGVVIILSLLFVTLERLPHNYWLSYAFQHDDFVEVVKKQPGEGVLDIPVSFYNTVYNIFPSVYDKKIISGNFIRSADTKQSSSFINATGLYMFTCSNEEQVNLNRDILLRQLKENDIYTIVIHKNAVLDHGNYYHPECANVRMQTSLLLQQIFMPNPTEKVKVFSISFPIALGLEDIVTFQYDGQFYLDGLHTYPKDMLPLHLYLDGKELSSALLWKDKGDGNVTAEPGLVLEVKKGSTLQFVFEKNNNIEGSFMNLWYRYISKTAPQENQSINGIRKVFEDDTAAVYHIE